LSSIPQRPAPDRTAAGDEDFNPNRHLWIDGEWWSADRLYKWTGADWTPAAAEAGRPVVRRAALRAEPPANIGVYAGWGSQDDLTALAVSQREAKITERWSKHSGGPGSALMLLYLPVTIGALILELSLKVPLAAALTSLVGVTAAFTLGARWLNRRQS
jgi:hypothetical protein